MGSHGFPSIESCITLSSASFVIDCACGACCDVLLLVCATKMILQHSMSPEQNFLSNRLKTFSDHDYHSFMEIFPDLGKMWQICHCLLKQVKKVLARSVCERILFYRKLFQHEQFYLKMSISIKSVRIMYKISRKQEAGRTFFVACVWEINLNILFVGWMKESMINKLGTAVSNIVYFLLTNNLLKQCYIYSTLSIVE